MAKRYKLLIGQYQENDADGVPCTYVAGNVFESEIDMLKFNGQGMSPKFEMVDENTRLTPRATIRSSGVPQPAIPPKGEQSKTKASVREDDGLDEMTVKELQAHAAEEEIDLHGASRKEDIVRLIREASPE